MKNRLLPALLFLTVVAAPLQSALAYVLISTTGCPEGRGAGWVGGKVSWHLNEKGSDDLEFGELEASMRRDFDSWSTPCCSSLQNVYLGTTKANWENQNSTPTFIAFVESGWPAELGASVIAVTRPDIRVDCTITAGKLFFNGEQFTFSLDQQNLSATRVDLPTTSIHEIGHLVGLAHTPDTTAIMYAFTSPGAVKHDLAQDDEDGICALYPGWCEPCDDARECPGELSCVDGSCAFPSCTKTADCAEGICFNETCVPGCRTNLDCPVGGYCEAGSCVVPPAECDICKSCETTDDCGRGSLPDVCVPWGDGSEGRCSKSCQSDSDCDGDSVCGTMELQGARYDGACVAPGSTPTDFCPTDYVCEPDPAKNLGCPLLWDRCSGGGGCGKQSDVCVETDAGSKCSCTCRSDAECGQDARCVVDPNTELATCFPDAALSPCDGGFCTPGLVCREGACVEPCEGVVCGEAERCEKGDCVSVCGSCPSGQRCDGETKRCFEPDPCADVSCDEGASCAEGVCVPAEEPCVGEGCPCVDSECGETPSPTKKRKAKSGCSAGADGASLAGLLLASATLGELRRHRAGASRG